MAESINQPTKTYLHFCDNCQKEIETAQKMDLCPNCRKNIKEVIGHFTYPTKASHIYYHLCENCKIQYDTNKEEQLCPQCNQPPKEYGLLIIRDRMPSTFWEKLSQKVRKYLP